MTKIEKKVLKKEDVTIYFVLGEFSVDQIISGLNEFYSSEYTRHLVFDLTKADVSSMTADEMKYLVETGKKKAFARSGGKTCLIVSGDLEYGLARMYTTFSEIKKHPVTHRIFDNIDDAMSWIKE